MLNKCANPECSAIFRTLRDGKVFVMEVKPDCHGGVSGHGREREYFWLCNSCCRNMTVIVDNGTRAQVVPRTESASATRGPS